MYLSCVYGSFKYDSCRVSTLSDAPLHLSYKSWSNLASPLPPKPMKKENSWGTLTEKNDSAAIYAMFW